jgi:hypothetical protein
MDTLEQNSFDPKQTQKEINTVFSLLCGEFPGAVTVRHSVKHFKRLGSIDHEEMEPFGREAVNSPTTMQLNVVTGDGVVSQSSDTRDTDQEMMDSEIHKIPPGRGYTPAEKDREDEMQIYTYDYGLGGTTDPKETTKDAQNADNNCEWWDYLQK